jgi:prepilin-type processing-associated H-X9-DG protein
MESAGPELDRPTSEEQGRRLDYAGPETRRASDPLAIASMACGLAFLPGVLLLIAMDGRYDALKVIVLSLPFVAIVLGLIARRSEKRRGVSGRAAARAYLLLAGVEVAVLLLIAVTLPQLGRSRETANRVKCGSNLRQIGMAVRLYADENGGRFPPDLETLLMTQDVIASMFVCPSSNDDAAKGPTTQAVIRELRSGAHYCSYVYVGAGLGNDTATEAHVVAYEPVANHHGDGMNVLYGDGHVEFLNRPESDRVLDELRHGHNPPRVGTPTSPIGR